MSVFNTAQPKISKNKLIIWLKSNYNFLNNKKLLLKELNSERDRNYLLSVERKYFFVVKVANSSESKDLLDMQDYVLSSLNKRKNILDKIPKKIHRSIKVIVDNNNRACYVRILSYIDGKMFALSKHSVELEKSLGSFIGNLSNELKNLGHAASFRKFEWDPSSISWLKKDFNLFKSNNKKILINNLIEYKNFFLTNNNNLRYSLTHGDPNNYNLIVNQNKIVGLIDYGDMIYAPTINDLAICLAYALMNKKDLYSSLKNIIISYNKYFPIKYEEIFSLMTLVKCRLSITVVMAEKQIKKFPKNKYLLISKKDAWDTLSKLDKINPYVFICMIRNLCNYPINKNYNNILNYLQNNKFGNIFNFDLNNINKFIKTSNFSKKNTIKENFLNIEIGLYGEKRNIYKGKNFVSFLNPKIRRDIHIGLDFFVEKNAKIFCPLDAKVILLKNNNNKHDYGPLVILEHNIKNKFKFFTLYGHLSKKSLNKLKINQKLKKGEYFAQIGNYKENGNWTPHLHFQIITHLMNETNNFPGVVEEFLFSMWNKISPDPNLFLKLPNSFFDKNSNIKKLLSKRKLYLSPNLSISYKKPLHILEAKYQYLYDDKGKQYLDCVNNISHVGHCHPKIHETIIKQNSKLNTNTRYIYEIITEYSEKLLNKFPNKLNKVFFVCTGSEANDLAYRIATNYTKSKEVIVMNNAYHGHTNTLIDLSPYKFNGKGGDGKKDFVHIADMPDGIRGEWLYSNKYWIQNYINNVEKLFDKINKKNKRISAFFIESILGCGGQIILPKNYLKEIYKLVKKYNSLLITDEVQTGFARVGNNFWAFEEHEIVPDIVTLGKPMGNGHPIAAVVTTEEIADFFNNGMEYFNSFGGNPVSCAVGNSVLDIIDEENLQSHAYEVGKYLLKLLQSIQNKFPQFISEVRGRGLFLGIDLIHFKNDQPDKKLAIHLINYMRDRGILLSTDGPFENVIKIKPPLKFNKYDADLLAYELESFFESF